MGIVVVPTFGADPVTITGPTLDAKVDGLATEFNGNIDNDNIDASAAIANSKLNLASISQNIAHSGTMTHSGTLTMTAKDISEAKGADVASATTTTIWVTDGNFIHITGTTTITSFGTAGQAGDERTIVFDGALTLTHNATSLILPTGANITTAAGDTAIVRAETTANARVISYNRKDGTTLSSVGGVLGSAKNLKVVRDSATQVTVTADELILEDSSNNKTTIRSVSEAIAITTSGASGLDTGAEGSSRYYYVYIIRKSSDGTVNGLLSESASSPTMPSGYDQKALVSVVRNDGSSNFVDFIQQGRKVYYPANIAQYNATPGAGAWVSVDTTSAIPSTLSDYGEFIISAGSASQSCTFTNDSAVAVAIGTAAPNKIVTTATTGYAVQDFISCPILTANTVYVAGSSTVILYVAGYEINKL